MQFDADIRVRYAETDQMGIVYHANYFPWFEEARTGFFEAIGLSYRQLEEQGFYFPLIECNCRFRQPARYADFITVRACLREVKGARVTLAYKVYLKPEGKLLAEGWTSHVFVGKGFRPLNMQRARPDIYEKMLKVVPDGAVCRKTE
jgi:acyl-CoA thioester hydrolase